MRIDEPNGCNLENHMLVDEPEDHPGYIECSDCLELVPEDEAVEIRYELYCDACALNYGDEDDEEEDVS